MTSESKNESPFNVFVVTRICWTYKPEPNLRLCNKPRDFVKNTNVHVLGVFTSWKGAMIVARNFGANTPISNGYADEKDGIAEWIINDDATSHESGVLINIHSSFVNFDTFVNKIENK